MEELCQHVKEYNSLDQRVIDSAGNGTRL